MHKNRTNLSSVLPWIKPLRNDLFNLMISTIKCLTKAPPTTPSHLSIVRDRHKISPIRNQLAIHGKHRRQSTLSLCERVVIDLKPPHRRLNQFTNRGDIFSRRNSQMKLIHPRSIKGHSPPEPTSSSVTRTRTDLSARYKSSVKSQPQLVRPRRCVLHSSP